MGVNRKVVEFLSQKKSEGCGFKESSMLTKSRSCSRVHILVLVMFPMAAVFALRVQGRHVACYAATSKEKNEA
jgi:hypothetical protein